MVFRVRIGNRPGLDSYSKPTHRSGLRLVTLLMRVAYIEMSSEETVGEGQEAGRRRSDGGWNGTSEERRCS